MLTRSKAPKRSAEDEISQLPQKSPKRERKKKNGEQSGGNKVLSSDEPANGANDEESAPEDNANDVEAEQDQPGVNATEKEELAEDETPTARGNEKAGPEDKRAAASSSEETPDDTPLAEEGAGAEGEDEQHHEESEPDEEEIARMKNRKAERLTAMNLLIQLTITIERRRILEAGATLLGNHPEGMQKLADLSANPQLPTNLSLDDKLPFEFYWDMQGIKEAVARANSAKESLEHLEEDYKVARKAFTDALVQRSFALLKVKDYSEKALQAHDQAVAEALEKVLSGCQSIADAREVWNTCLAGVDGKLETPLDKAEYWLEQCGLLRPKAADDQSQQGHGSAAALSDDPSRRHEAGSGDLASDDEPAHGRPWDEEQHSQHEQAKNAPSRPSERASRPDKQSRRRGSVLDIIRGDTQNDLEEARQQYLETQSEFHKVGNDYYRQLDGFLRARERGSLSGSVTDFDADYFISRGRENQNFARAQEDWKDALEQVDKTDSLTTKQRERYLGDNEGSEHSWVFRRDRIYEKQEKRMEQWTDSEGMDEVRSERHWPGMVECIDEGGKTVGDFESIEMRGSLFSPGQITRKIDEWQAEQANTRTKIERDRARQEQAEEEPLPWWQVWDGI